MPAIIRDGAPVEILPGEPFTDGEGRSYPRDWLALATAAQRAAVPVLDIVEPHEPPAGKIAVSLPGPLALDGGRPVRRFELRDAVVPRLPDLSDRQFGEGLWRDGLIPFQDYLDFVGPGTIPARLRTIIDRLPDDDTGGPSPRKVALGLVTGAQSYRFANPLVELVRQDIERADPRWTPAYLRARWAVWATLE